MCFVRWQGINALCIFPCIREITKIMEIIESKKKYHSNGGCDSYFFYHTHVFIHEELPYFLEL